MNKALMLMTLMTIGATPDDGPAAKPLPDDPAYVAVRQDIFEKMNLADINLPKCEKSLGAAQESLVKAQANIDGLHAAAKALEQQKADLDAHITRLESVIKRYEDYTATLVQLNESQGGDGIVDQLGRGWEEVDGAVGLFAGYALGTGTCVGMAYVFNQPAFGGSAP